MASHYYSLSSNGGFSERSAWNAFGQGAPFGVSPSSSGLAFAFDFNFDGMDDVIIGNRIYLSQYADTTGINEQQWDTKRHVGKQFTSFMPKAIDAIRVAPMGTAFCCIAFDDNSVVLYRVQAVPSSSSLEFVFADRLDATGSRGEVTSISMFVDVVHEDIYRAKIGVLVTYSDANDVVFIRKFPIWTTDIERNYTMKSETTMPIQTTVPVPTLASSASVWPTKIGHTVNGAPSPPPLPAFTRYKLSQIYDYDPEQPVKTVNCDSLTTDEEKWEPVTTVQECRTQSAALYTALGSTESDNQRPGWPTSQCMSVLYNEEWAFVHWMNPQSWNEEIQFRVVCKNVFEFVQVIDVFFLATPVGFPNLLISERDGYMQRTLSTSTTENSVAVSSIVLQSELSSYTIAVCFANDNTQNLCHYVTISSIVLNEMQRYYDFDDQAYMCTSTFGDADEETVDIKLVDIDRDSYTDIVTIERSGYARVYRGSAVTQERFNFSHVVPEPLDAAYARAFTSENAHDASASGSVRRLQSQIPGSLTGEERFLARSKLVVGRCSNCYSNPPNPPPPPPPPPAYKIVSPNAGCQPPYKVIQTAADFSIDLVRQYCAEAADMLQLPPIIPTGVTIGGALCLSLDGGASLTVQLAPGAGIDYYMVCRVDVTPQYLSDLGVESSTTTLTRRERDAHPVKFLITHHYSPNTRGGSCSMRCHEANRMGYDSFKLFDNSIASVDEDDLNLYYQAGEPTRCLCGPRFDAIDAPYVEFELMEPTSTQTSYFNLLTVCPPRTGTRRQRRQHRPPLRHRRRRRRHSRLLKHLLRRPRFR